MLNKLWMLGISTQPVDLLILLGGGNYDTIMKDKIAKSLMEFVSQTGKAADL